MQTFLMSGVSKKLPDIHIHLLDEDEDMHIQVCFFECTMQVLCQGHYSPELD